MSISMIDLYIVVGALVFFAIGLRTGLLRSVLSVLCVYASIYIAQTLAPAIISTDMTTKMPSSSQSSCTQIE